MATTSKSPSPTADREIAITRAFNAPRELVYEAWTNPQHVAKWWGPNGFTNTVLEMDVRPGGVWRVIMHGPNGVDFPNKITYIEVVKNQRLVYWHGEDVEGNDGAFHVTVTFRAVGKQTEVDMVMLFNTATDRDRVVKEYGAIEGNTQTFNRLEAYLQNM